LPFTISTGTMPVTITPTKVMVLGPTWRRDNIDPRGAKIRSTQALMPFFFLIVFLMDIALWVINSIHNNR
jgi:hypothetical protein